MSEDNILPMDVQLEIMKRLPVKSLLQFRSVSKAWYSLITTSDFIHAHQKKTQHLLVWYADDNNYFMNTFASIVDDVTFPNQKASLVPPQLMINNLKFALVVGCSGGLLCIYGQSSIDKKMTAVIWNISIRKEVAVVLHNVDGQGFFLGFGVCRESNDPTIVKILTGILCQAYVFKLSTGAWRRLDNASLLLPGESFKFGCVQVQRCLYWLAAQNINLNGSRRSKNLIVSFDMKTEEFKLVKLPDTLVDVPTLDDMSLLKLRESLVVSECVDEITTNIWRMEDGVPNTFTKLFSFNNNNLNLFSFNNNNLNYEYLDYEYASVEGFRNNGKPIIEIQEPDDDDGYNTHKLVVYDPSSKHIESLGITTTSAICVHPYKETLLLLDQPNLKFYNYVLES